MRFASFFSLILSSAVDLFFIMVTEVTGPGTVFLSLICCQHSHTNTSPLFRPLTQYKKKNELNSAERAKNGINKFRKRDAYNSKKIRLAAKITTASPWLQRRVIVHFDIYKLYISKKYKKNSVPGLGQRTWSVDSFFRWCFPDFVEELFKVIIGNAEALLQ